MYPGRPSYFVQIGSYIPATREKYEPDSTKGIEFTARTRVFYIILNDLKVRPRNIV